MSHDHKADQQRMSGQNSLTDLTRTGEHLPRGDGLFTRMVNGTLRAVARQSPYAKTVQDSTDFGDTSLGLNQLLDLVEQTNLEDLASSGKALWDARDAIKSAAEELAGHIDNVHWVGEAGDAFRQWGGSLVGKTLVLSDFAGGAGDQLTAAADGLASVRGAMPSRDTQANRKRPHEFTPTERAANKDDYDAAVKVEKDRQEAINQMNRLASYYAVSNKELASLEGPTFDPMPNVGVPAPAQSKHDAVPQGVVSGGASGSGGTTVPTHHTAATPSVHADDHAEADSPTPVRHQVTQPAHHIVPAVAPVGTDPVGTGIDSVGTLPPSVSSPPTAHTPPVTGGPAPSGGHLGMFEGGPGAPLPYTSGRGPAGSGGFRTPAAYGEGRTAASGQNAAGAGRSQSRGPMNQTGRSAPTRQPMGKGGAQAGGKSSPTSMGRGVTGGTPRPGGTAGPRGTVGRAAGAGRGNGVIGGRPTTTSGAAAKGGGSRIPRGTVVGAEEVAGSRSGSGRPGTRGVFGSPESAAKPRTGMPASRTGGGATEPVSGRPAGRSSASRAERDGMTRGGTGLVRGPAKGQKREDEESTEGAPRPDYAVEETETHLPTKSRRDVPPVVN